MTLKSTYATTSDVCWRMRIKLIQVKCFCCGYKHWEIERENK